MPELAIQASPHPVPLAPISAPQMCYTLLNIRAVADGTQPLHCAVLVDVSQSMRIPIVDQSLFRTLVQQGGAYETLVDGTPVWQLGGTPALPATSTLTTVVDALQAVMVSNTMPDGVSIIGVGEAAHVLAEHETDHMALQTAIAQLSTLPAGMQTDLSSGIERALAALEQSTSARAILILTDGVTADQERCLVMARRAAAANVRIIAIGIGSESPDDLLLALALITGGQALFVPKLRDLLPRLRHELQRVRELPLPDVSVLFVPGTGVQLRSLTQIQPTIAALPLIAHQHMLAVTYTPTQATTTLLLASVADTPVRSTRQLCTVAVQQHSAPTATLAIATRTYAQPPALLPTVIQATQHVAYWQQAQRALAAQGDQQDAQQRLDTLAKRLIAQGMTYQAAALRAIYTERKPLPVHQT